MIGRARWVLSAAGVNAITFATKRVFHGFLRVTRKPLQQFGLTAARFDLLSVLVNAGAPFGRPQSLAQSEVRKALGVTAPVITRMMKALERGGLVTRQRARGGDRRQVWVSLTQEGERCIREARRVMIKAMKRLVVIAICFGRHRNADEQLRHTDTLESYLHVLRESFGDRATLHYPWGHPDD